MPRPAPATREIEPAASASAGRWQARAYALLTDDAQARACSDIPEHARRAQPGNFLTHVAALAATKLGDGLVDPKLVLAWLLGSLGAPAALIGLLVPVREAGALLPQLAIAAGMRALPVRKWVWAAGALVQGTAVGAMALAVLALPGRTAAWVVLGLLAVFALARAACSVSHKDVLGKTLVKSTRGTATGTAATLAACGALAYGALLSLGVLDRSVAVVSAGLLVAAVLWLAAAALFVRLDEAPGESESSAGALDGVREQWSLLRRDRQLQRFIATRCLLLATALAPPFVLALGAGSAADGALGQFISAAALAALCSTYVWGRLSDRSSRKVLIAAALAAALALGAAVVLAWAAPAALGHEWVLPGVLFVLLVAHQGVRLGRSTHVVDMAEAGQRASYTAVSNTVVGVALLAGAGFGLIAQAAGSATLLALFCAMCLGAAVLARGLREAQHTD